MAIIMTLWTVNGAVLKSSSQWQLKEFHGRNYLIFQNSQCALHFSIMRAISV